MIELNAVAKEIVKCLERVGFPFIAPHCRFFVHFLNMNLQHFTLMRKLVKLQCIPIGKFFREFFLEIATSI